MTESPIMVMVGGVNPKVGNRGVNLAVTFTWMLDPKAASYQLLSGEDAAPVAGLTCWTITSEALSALPDELVRPSPDRYCMTVLCMALVPPLPRLVVATANR